MGRLFWKILLTFWVTLLITGGITGVTVWWHQQTLHKLSEDIRKVVNTPEFRKGLQEQGMSAVANTPVEAQSFVAREKQRWDQVIAAGKITAN